MCHNVHTALRCAWLSQHCYRFIYIKLIPVMRFVKTDVHNVENKKKWFKQLHCILHTKLGFYFWCESHSKYEKTNTFIYQRYVLYSRWKCNNPHSLRGNSNAKHRFLFQILGICAKMIWFISFFDCNSKYVYLEIWNSTKFNGSGFPSKE